MTDLRNKNNKLMHLIFQVLRKILLLNILLVAGTGILLAQKNGSVAGVVKDTQSGETLIGANVFIEGTSNGAATNIDGEFILNNVPSGDHKLKVTYIGYTDKVIDISVAAGEKTVINIDIAYSGIELGAIQVTAQARGQISAINNQLNSQDIRNVVSAERIQELPDANAAETIGRMSGVSIKRVGGEGNKVVVRGLSPKYSKITVEGVSMAASGGDRSSDISMISPYSLDGIEVIKAATANLDADFIGGMVNFKLRDADPGWRSDIVAQSGYNDLKKTFSDYMVTGNVSNRFFDDKLGVYFQGNIEKRNRSSNDLSASYNNTAGPIDPIVGENNTVYTSSFAISDVIRKKSRYGSTLVLDYKIPDGVIHLKNFYSQSGTDIDRYRESYTVAAPYKIGYTGSREEWKLQTYSNIMDYEQRFNSLLVNAKISHSYSESSSPKNNIYSFSQRDGMSLPEDVRYGELPPHELVKYKTVDTPGTLTWFDEVRENYSVTQERQLESTIDLKYDFSISKQISGNIKAGGKYRYKDRMNNRTVYGSNLNLGRDANNTILDANPWMWDKLVEFYDIDPNEFYTDKLPYALFMDRDFDHKDFLGGKYTMEPVPDLDLLESSYDAVKAKELEFANYTFYNRSSNNNDYSGNEYFYAAYLMSEINIGKHVKFIPGVRYENNKTVYTANRGWFATSDREWTDYKPLANNKLDTTMTRNNNFLLPMIHLKIDPTDWFNIRVAYTHSLARPGYSQIVPISDTRGNVVRWNNYKLKPEYSRNFDLYLSFHNDHIGLLTMGGFIKKIDNMIFNLGRRMIVDSTYINDLPESYINSTYIYTAANNPNQAKIYGVELDWQTTFWYLPGVLKGLVLNANYTHIFSEAKYPYSEIKNNNQTIPWLPPDWENINTYYVSQLIDQPDDIVNVQVGYDYKGFSARVSMLYQSSIFKQANYFPELSTYADDYLRWDISLKQKLPWHNIMLFCNLNNITSAEDRDLVEGSAWDSKIQRYGMTVDLGLRVKLHKQ
ncbi:MAG: TonB-dependent receptor [Bacteroidota bacterium]